MAAPGQVVCVPPTPSPTLPTRVVYFAARQPLQLQLQLVQQQQQQQIHRAPSTIQRMQTWPKQELREESGTNERPPKEGSSIRIGSHVFEFVAELGRGSFGVVWDAISRSGPPVTAGPVAIKWSAHADVGNWEDCVFEASVLKQLSDALPRDSGCEGRFPRYVAHTGYRPRPSPPAHFGAAKAHSKKGTVSIAMTKVAGRPLDRWLYGFDEQRLKTIPISELLDAPSEHGQVSSRNLNEAGQAASTLLSQMAPVFEALATIAFHRDVSAHNVLVDAESSKLTFAVIDFGLAVSSRRWGAEYEQKILAGTPHYFPPATWMIFARGRKYVQEHPDRGALRQYLERLDHFSMGVLALELFFALWNGMDSDAAAPPEEVVTARVAWRTFWGTAVSFYQQFHRQGVENFRKLLMGSQALSDLQHSLDELQQALRLAASTNESRGFAPLLVVAADLIDARGTLSWSDIPEVLRAEGISPPSSPARNDSDAALRRPRKESEIMDLPTIPRTHTHRRVWSTDDAWSLARHRPEVPVSCDQGSDGSDHLSSER